MRNIEPLRGIEKMKFHRHMAPHNKNFVTKGRRKNGEQRNEI
jgi:hypothetical protein